MLINRIFARSASAITSTPPSSVPPSSRPQVGLWRSNAYLLTPLASIIIFALVMSLILWSLDRREQQRQENTLYRNVGWAQQQIRLALTTIQRQIVALSHSIAIGHYDALN